MDSMWDELQSASTGRKHITVGAAVADPRIAFKEDVREVSDSLMQLVASDFKTEVCARKMLGYYNNKNAIIRAIEKLRQDPRQAEWARKVGAMAVMNTIMTEARRLNVSTDLSDFSRKFL